MGLAFALVVLGIVFVFGSPKPQGAVLSSTFASEPVEIKVREVLPEEFLEKTTPSRVIVPDLGIDLEVSRSEIVDGYWEVFLDKAGWGIGSGFPGEVGNQVIFAHAREGQFLPLRSIESGMKIYVLAGPTEQSSAELSWFEYEVNEITEVLPSDTQVIAPSEDERLTLYTCSGFKDSQRLIVVAKRII